GRGQQEQIANRFQSRVHRIPNVRLVVHDEDQLSLPPVPSISSSRLNRTAKPALCLLYPAGSFLPGSQTGKCLQEIFIDSDTSSNLAWFPAVLQFARRHAARTPLLSVTTAEIGTVIALTFHVKSSVVLN